MATNACKDIWTKDLSIMQWTNWRKSLSGKCLPSTVMFSTFVEANKMFQSQEEWVEDEAHTQCSLVKSERCKHTSVQVSHAHDGMCNVHNSVCVSDVQIDVCIQIHGRYQPFPTPHGENLLLHHPWHVDMQSCAVCVYVCDIFFCLCWLVWFNVIGLVMEAWWKDGCTFLFLYELLEQSDCFNVRWNINHVALSRREK